MEGEFTPTTVSQVTFDLKPDNFDLPVVGGEAVIRGQLSVLQMTTGVKCCAEGTSVPSVLFNRNVMRVSSAINGDGNYYKDSDDGYCVRYSQIYKNKCQKRENIMLENGKWTTIDISQTLINGKFMYKIKIGEKELWSVENQQPRIFSDVHVYAGARHAGLDGRYNIYELQGSIRNLKIETDIETARSDTEFDQVGCRSGYEMEPEGQACCEGLARAEGEGRCCHGPWGPQAWAIVHWSSLLPKWKGQPWAPQSCT